MHMQDRWLEGDEPAGFVFSEKPKKIAKTFARYLEQVAGVPQEGHNGLEQIRVN